MKYEMIFGDEGLFFDAQKDCEMVGNGHHKVENGKLMVWNFSEKRWCNSHTNTITISAMRRIIAEPNRWTVEDQKAGRLPPAGSKYLAGTHNIELECLYNDSKGNAWGFDAQGEVYGFAIKYCSPIETPAEKAQREEDEFVESTCRQNEPHSTLYSDGVRAAYRKMKGGE